MRYRGKHCIIYILLLYNSDTLVLWKQFRVGLSSVLPIKKLFADIILVLSLKPDKSGWGGGGVVEGGLEVFVLVCLLLFQDVFRSGVVIDFKLIVYLHNDAIMMMYEYFYF